MSTHEHEKWQIQDDGCGPYCAACGDKIIDPERCPSGDPECDTDVAHDGCVTPSIEERV